MWKAIEDNLQNLEYENYLFLHSGGLSANESILERYKFLNLLQFESILTSLLSGLGL